MGSEPEINGGEFYAEVALPIPIYENFTYSVPPNLAEKIVIGSRVIVPFGKAFKTGIIIDFADSTRIENVKTLVDLADEDPPVTPHIIDLCCWIAEYYLCPLGEVFAQRIPPE